MEERIQKIISAAGVTSRRAAEELIAEGRVRVNGAVVTELGSKADPEKDHIKVDGKLINPHQPKTYIMLNKPVGYVTTMADPEGRRTVQDLLKGVKVRVYPVGRLDYNTEGMLIMTNDGDFAHLVTHPRHELPKTYLAKLKGVLDDKQIEMIETGLFLDDGKTAPAKLRKIRKEEANSWVEITITEGRKRQVRRMFDRVGRSVIKLKRTKTGNLVLGDLAEGSFRYLTPVEVKGLMDLSQQAEVKPLRPTTMRKPAVFKKEGAAAGGPGMGSRSPRPEYRSQGTTGRGRDDKRPAKFGERAPRAGVRVMQDTSDGRRKNQVVKPRPDREPTRESIRTARATDVRGREKSDRGTAPAAPFRKTASVPAGNREARRIPAQRSWAATKGSEARSRDSAYEREVGRRPSAPRRSAFAGITEPGRSAFAPRKESTYSPASRPAASRPSMRPGTGRPASGSSVGTEVRRKPDQRPWPSTRKSAPGRKEPGIAPAYGQRSVSFPRPVTRPAASRPAATAGANRPAPGAFPGRPETKRKPAPRSWPGAKSGDGRSKSPGYAPRSGAGRPSSGPRPNKSTHTGSRGPGRGPISKGRGQGASNRGPRR